MYLAVLLYRSIFQNCIGKFYTAVPTERNFYCPLFLSSCVTICKLLGLQICKSEK